MAVLLEHTAGKFPLWLTPDQAVVLPISEKYNEYAEEVVAYLNQHDVRAQGEGDKGSMTLEEYAKFMGDLVAKEIEAI